MNSICPETPARRNASPNGMAFSCRAAGRGPGWMRPFRERLVRFDRLDTPDPDRNNSGRSGHRPRHSGVTITARRSGSPKLQQSGNNVYFQPNETHPGCTKKAKQGCRWWPRSAAMRTSIPTTNTTSSLRSGTDYIDLLSSLTAEPTFPPSVIINSGNGPQGDSGPCHASSLSRLSWTEWSARTSGSRPLSARPEHMMFSRLLRMPGTVNFPNANERSRGRGVSRARLLHASPASYTPAEAAVMGEHLQAVLAGSPLVRLNPVFNMERKARQSPPRIRPTNSCSPKTRNANHDQPSRANSRFKSNQEPAGYWTLVSRV